MQNILKDMGLITNKGENNSLLNIYSKVPKAPAAEQQHIKVPEPGYIYQADLLFLPLDKGYNYLLVLIDNNNNACDFEPLKNKTAKDTLAAIKIIFSRDYLKRPKFSIEVDPGGEFEGVFKKFFEKATIREDRVYIRQGKTGRHKQQSLVENLNKIIGQVIHMQLTQDDIDANTDQSRDWIDMLPRLRESLNKNLIRNKSKVIRQMTLKKCHGELIPIGARVRVALDNPQGVTGKTLHGTFRAGDPKWEVKERTVEQYILRPDQPPMYIISGINNCVYTKYQLQVIDNEVRPKQRIYIIEKIFDRRKEKRNIVFSVKWKDSDEITTESRVKLMKSNPEIIKEYESKKHEEIPEPEPIAPEPEPIAEDEPGGVYEVEKLLGRKTIKGKVYFVVKWKNYDEPTTELRSTLNKTIPDMIAEYEAKNKRKVKRS